MNSKQLSKKLTQFEGTYMSGFFVTNPAMVTALSLLFEKVYLPNQLELVTEITKKFKISTAYDDKIKVNFEEIDENGFKSLDNPLEQLSPTELKTAENYLLMAHHFCMKHNELFPEVFETDMLKENAVFDVKLIEKGKNGKKNKYRVKTNPLEVTLDGFEQIENRLQNGSVPLIGLGQLNINKLNKTKVQDKSIAALIAMQSIEMVLPATKGVEPQLILEARDKLSDHLPQFWSSMLKFSKDGKKIIEQSSNMQEAISECQNLVDTTIRPTLIDLNQKIIRDNKNWFYKILSPIGDKLKLVVGKPDLTNLDLLSTSMSLATDVGLDYIQHKRKIKELKDEAGLTYLLKLGKQIE